MAKVVGIHEVELRPGIQAEDFERFVTQEFIPAHQEVSGFTMSFLKGERGQRTGQYIFLGTTDSLERHNELFLPNGEASEEIEQAVTANAALWETLSTFVVNFPDPNFTDYVMV